jgi:hypothetical protein
MCDITALLLLLLLMCDITALLLLLLLMCDIATVIHHTHHNREG